MASESTQGADQTDQGRFISGLVFGVSAAVLLLQLVQTRIFGVISWNHIVYFIITIALLGFGISGTWLAFGRESRLGRLLTLSRCCFAFVITTLISSLFVSQIQFEQAVFGANIADLLQQICVYSLALLPYFFAGWILGSIFRDHASDIGRLYAIDLVGAAAGCLAYLALIRKLGAVNLVVLVCALPLFPFLVWRDWTRRRALKNTLLLVILAAVAYSHPEIEAGIEPHRTKGINSEFPKRLEPGDRKIVELREWNAISRIDVASSVLAPWHKGIFIDGDAWTTFVARPPGRAPPWNRDKEWMMGSRLPYLVRSNPERVLVIGSGGGVDIWVSLRGGARSVDAVELNPTTYRISLHRYRGLTHSLFYRKGVKLYNEEGRSFVRRSAKRYDIILMHGIDTFAAINSGAYMFAENNLYTTDGIRDYYEHLADDGILYIGRWLHPGEGVRLFTTALEALHELGLKHPERHLMMLSETPKRGNAMLLLKRSPWSKAELEAFIKHQNRTKACILYPPGKVKVRAGYEAVLARYVKLRAKGKQEAFFARWDFDVRPVDDDSPFFFNYEKWSHVIRAFRGKGDWAKRRGNWPTITLWALFLLAILAVAAFMILPLLAIKRRRGTELKFGLWLVYFACIGVGYIFVEVALMQRFALFLGHPQRSLAVVLAGLLAASGVGSLRGERLQLSHRTKMLAVVAMIFLVAFVYPLLIKALLGWPLWARGVATVLMVFPVGFFMGMPFPKGVAMVAALDDNAVPWMWGVNGGTTVLGSIAAVVLAIGTGFTHVLIFAGVAYLLGTLAFVRLTRA